MSCSQTFLDKRDKVESSVTVGDRWRRLDPRRDRGLALWRHRVSRVCVFNPLLSVSLLSAAKGEKDGYFYERCPSGYGVLKRPRRNVKLQRSFWWSGLPRRRRGTMCFFLLCSHLAQSTEVIVAVDNVDIEHLR